MASETGKVVYMDEPGHVEIREYEVPSADPGAVVADVVQANVCGSEIHIFGGHHPQVQTGILGHEVLCRVKELGDGVEIDSAGEPVEVGDRIVPVYFRTCQQCSSCNIGEFNLCQNAYEHWSRSPDEPPHFHGTFGTHYYITPEQYFFTVPEGVDSEIAAAANCALSQVMYGLDRVEVGADDTVVIQGAGGLGLNSVAVCNERGAETIVIEGVDGRIDRAHEFGADHVIDFREHDTVEARADRVRELTDGVGADVGVEVAGVPEAFAEGIHLLRDGGRYLEMGNISPGITTEFDPGTLTRTSIQITALVRYQPWYLHKALTFLDANADDYPYGDLIDATFDLADAEEAIEQSTNREITRAALRP